MGIKHLPVYISGFSHKFLADSMLRVPVSEKNSTVMAPQQWLAGQSLKTFGYSLDSRENVVWWEIVEDMLEDLVWQAIQGRLKVVPRCV
jgi:hypothetical protein